MNQTTSNSLQFLRGALLINKPVDASSNQVLQSIKHHLCKSTGLKLKQLPKVGHGGTLDPFATGLLVVYFGQATRLSRYGLSADKGYEGTLIFGQESASGDITNEITGTSSVIPESIELVQSAANSFLGIESYSQLPPMFSAKKVNGRPLYHLARQGKEVERKEKLCSIHEFRILGIENQRCHFSVKCSSGTYIRTLAQDLAKKLGTLGVLENLTRTMSGTFDIEHSISLEALFKVDAQEWKTLRAWTPCASLVGNASCIEVDPNISLKVRQGQSSFLSDFLSNVQGDRAILKQSDELVAVAVKKHHTWEYECVMSA